MLRSLSIQNYALIDSLEIELGRGLSVITGETGAGKSILLGALSLILGQRADLKSLKDESRKCVIEGVFDLTEYGLSSLFQINGWEYEEANTILRREILPSGKSRAFVNDSPVSLQELKVLGSHLIDIHSQHQNMLLSDDSFQLTIVDILAKTTELYCSYKISYDAWRKEQSLLRKIKEERIQVAREEEYLRFQWQQLSEAKLSVEEFLELECEQNQLAHAEEIKGILFRIGELFDGEEAGGILSMSKESSSLIEGLSRKLSLYGELSERLASTYIELKDIAAECSRSSDLIELNELRLEQVNERLGLLYGLMQKHHVRNMDELLAVFYSVEEKLNFLTGFDDRIDEVEIRIAQLEKELSLIGSKLSIQRKEAAFGIEKGWIDMVSVLGMPNVKIKLDFVSQSSFSETGLEKVSILFAANKNAPLQPIGDTASGGEISRMMLVVKSLIAGQMALPTIVFDEIDTGVSGEIADKMGNIMVDMSIDMQVICITHLPQIAAQGTCHYKVYKEDSEQSTTTRLRLLSNEERVVELAGMISGSQITESALQHARSIIRK